MLMMYVGAPFAAFRPFVAGSYRQTLPFVTPTAAYGLLLNLAGIESRRIEPDATATDTAFGLPPCELAIGVLRAPAVGRMLQQLHNYPVGSSGKDHAPATKGTKYNIQPIVREVLFGVEAIIGLRGDDELEALVCAGLDKGLTSARRDGQPRYGVPFLGDNSFLVDVLKVLGFHRSVGLPVTLKQLGIEDESRENLIQAAEIAFGKGSFMHNLSFETSPDMILDAVIGADAHGKGYS